MNSSNGCALGNTFSEAVLQGFFELVERDAVATWWYYNRLLRPVVNLESFGQPYLLQLVEHYLRTCNRKIWALDISSDLGIPVFVVLSSFLESPKDVIFFGFCCHLDAHIALQRAFTEMNQMLGVNSFVGRYGDVIIEEEDTLT